jgi:hypothetical protein
MVSSRKTRFSETTTPYRVAESPYRRPRGFSASSNLAHAFGADQILVSFFWSASVFDQIDGGITLQWVVAIVIGSYAAFG